MREVVVTYIKYERYEKKEYYIEDNRGQEII